MEYYPQRHRDISFQVFHLRLDLKVDNSSTAITFSSEKPNLTVRQEYLAPLRSNVDIITIEHTVNGIDVSVDYAFPIDFPIFLIRCRLSNHFPDAVHCNFITLIDNSSVPSPQFPSVKPDYACFVNGWQSWSFSGTYSSKEKQKIPGLNFVQGPLWHDSATPIPKRKGMFTSDLFTVLIDRCSQKGILAGFLSQKQQFGHAEVDLRDSPNLQLKASGDGVRILSGESLETDWAVLQVVDFTDPDPLKSYIEASALVNKVTIKPDIPVGWCSWYQYYTHITPKNLLSNIARLQEIKTDIPLDLIQIDDGFEKAVGDWLECKRAFPEGLGAYHK